MNCFRTHNFLKKKLYAFQCKNMVLSKQNWQALLNHFQSYKIRVFYGIKWYGDTSLWMTLDRPNHLDFKISLKTSFLSKKLCSSKSRAKTEVRMARDCGKMTRNCSIFLYSNFPEFSGIRKNFPRPTFREFPGKFPVGKSPGNITTLQMNSM